MLQSRMLTMEEGRDGSSGKTSHQPRFLQFRVIQFLLVFLVLGLGVSIVSLNMIRYFGVKDIVPALQSKNLLCDEEPNSLERWIRPPSNVMHTMNDTELLWRASFTTAIKEWPYRRTPKIAFMFLTKGPLPLAPLWERFFKGHEYLFSIYMHSQPGYAGNFSKSSVFYNRNIPSQITRWGEMSMCEAERRLLANALLDLSNEWFVLLSEACIPLQNFSIVYHYLSRSRYSFMGSVDAPGPDGRGRYNWRMAPEVNLTEWRKGSQWFEVNRKLAVDIVKDTIYYPKFRDFCKPQCYVDEHYFPTMLGIQSPRFLANRSLTWVDWSRGGAHPATYGRSDISESFFKKIFDGTVCIYNDQPSTVCYLFARKFAPSALEPLLEVASKALGF